MKISFAATNPCHVYPFAVELAKLGALGSYYSGYPAWKLPDTDGLPIRAHSLRTNIVYGLLKYAPERLRPSSRRLFLWQDRGFDRWAGVHLDPCDFIHGIPGQCLYTFRAAKKLGVRTVLNHATGPVRDWVRIMEPEYSRVGLRLVDACPYDVDYFRRLRGAKRLPSFPNIPTFIELGYPDVEFYIWAGLFAPKATPPDNVRILREATKKAANSPEFKNAMEKLNTPVYYLDGPDFQKFWDKDAARLIKAIRAIGKVQ